MADVEKLVEVRRDQQHATPFRRGVTQRFPYEGGGADVQPPRRLRGNDEPRVLIDLASQDELLRVAAR